VSNQGGDSKDGTRRRDEVLMAAIQAATRAELAERGYAGVTFEGVARRARTSKPVLYRRYRSRAHMVADALPALHWQPLQETAGSLRQDLLLIVTAILDRFHLVGVDTYRRLGAEADDELFDEMSTLLSELTSRTFHRALSDARERGEIGPVDIPERVEMTLLALVRNELFFTRNPVDHNTVTDFIDVVYIPLINAVSQSPRGLASSRRRGRV
jgi:AcrR family transcriptional regulator